jgi:hypothetical protein
MSHDTSSLLLEGSARRRTAVFVKSNGALKKNTLSLKKI